MLAPVTLDQIRIFLTVTQCGSFSAAARKLGRAQSGVSQAVQSLEAALGAELFHRDTRTPRITEAGRTLLRDSKLVLRDVEMLQARARGIGDDLETGLAITAEPPLPNTLLIQSLQGLRREFPKLPVSLTMAGVGQSIGRLREGAADIALCSVSSASAVGMQVERLARISIVSVVAVGHPLAKIGGAIAPEVLAEHTELALVAVEGNASEGAWLFVENGRRMEFLLAGLGWANMARPSVESHLLSGQLKELRLAEPRGYEIAMHFVHRKKNKPGRAARWFITDIRHRLGNMA